MILTVAHLLCHRYPHGGEMRWLLFIYACVWVEGKEKERKGEQRKHTNRDIFSRLDWRKSRKERKQQLRDPHKHFLRSFAKKIVRTAPWHFYPSARLQNATRRRCNMKLDKDSFYLIFIIKYIYLYERIYKEYVYVWYK